MQTPMSPDPQTEPVSEPEAGQLVDYVSGRLVKASPEEVEAVQVFSRRLVEEFGYPLTRLQTRPQFRVRPRPSGERSSGYPVDIVVFSADRRLEDDAYIIVECKRKQRKDGEAQLKLYLTMSPAQIGAWFNGSDHLYLLKVYQPDGSIQWEELPSLPRFGQTVSEIGQFTRKDLVAPTNLRAVFRDIRNHLAGNTTGITRDQALAQEMISLLFCKIYDELETAPDEQPLFRAGYSEPVQAVRSRIDTLFNRVKAQYVDVFQAHDALELDDNSLFYIVGELQNYAIVQASRDAIGDAFEVFIGPAVRGEEGQFFTPRNVVQMMVSVLDPGPDDLLIDPACGSGGFLIVALEHIWKKLEATAAVNGWTEAQLERRRREVATRCIRGLDKDAFLTKVTKAYLAIIGDGRGGIYCEDSLAEPDTWSAQAQAVTKLGTFDIVITNPPFGSKIKATGAHKLSQYELAREWKPSKTSPGDYEKSDKLKKDQSPQILFIERCIQLLKPGGRLAIVLPESVFGMSNYGHVVQYMYDRFKLRAFVSLPEEVFQPYTHAKTCVVFLTKDAPLESEVIEMAIADWCGHDSRGNPTVRRSTIGEEQLLDDIPIIAVDLAAKRIWVR
jgi:type I restriction enzyme M protein